MRTLIARVLLACFALSLLALPAAADDAPVGVRKPMPKSVKALEQQLGSLQKRLDELVKVAKRDPAELKIAVYRKYGPKMMKKTRGRVRAEELLEYMVDKTKNFETVRKPAMEAILEGGRILGDPELSVSEKQGSRTKRANFCLRKVAPILKDDEVDRFARRLAADLLAAFYGRGRSITEIRAYNHDKDDTWKPAYNAWVKFLRKQ